MKGIALTLVVLLAAPACHKAHGDSSDWATYTDPDLHFSVETPRKPRYDRTVRAFTEDGYALPDTISFGSERTAGIIEVVVTPMPFAEGHGLGTDLMFDDAIKNALDTISGQITGKQEVTVNGVPGREVTATGKDTKKDLASMALDGSFLIEGPILDDDDIPEDPSEETGEPVPVAALLRMFYQNAMLYQVVAIYPTDATAMRDEAAQLVRSFQPIPPTNGSAPARKAKGSPASVMSWANKNRCVRWGTLPTGGGTISLRHVSFHRAARSIVWSYVNPEFTVELDEPLKRHESIAVYAACQSRRRDVDFIDCDMESLSHHDRKTLRSARTLTTDIPVKTVEGTPHYCQFSFTLRTRSVDRASLGDFCWTADGTVTPGLCRR